ncbi:MerR family transcriptional regulator [Nocardia sp. NPDC057030]|uniref:DNA polymerase III subunit beta family protein n=1 Tax=unclassified Nocardia TaxID=2637762 RepID=UPI0036396E37
MADELITIGVLARASGLTASALRFYDDCGLLPPARVDPLTGYRYYTEDQRERAMLIRRLRAIEVPLESISEILSGDVGRAERVLDAHVGELKRRAVAAAVVAESIKRTLSVDGRVVLPAAMLAEAFDQVRAAAASNREIPVLAGILLEASGNSLTLTATDRYRLSTRTLVSRDRQGDDWSLVVDGRDLAPIADWLRGPNEIAAAPTDHALLLADADADASGGSLRCRVIDEPFPDYRAVLSGSAPVRTRVLTPRTPLLELLENESPTVQLEVGPTGITVSGKHLSATVTGSTIDLFFEVTTLLPAINTALGPDLMLDIAAADHPVVIRSATDGDLTTLAMPTWRPTTG